MDNGQFPRFSNCKHRQIEMEVDIDSDSFFRADWWAIMLSDEVLEANFEVVLSGPEKGSVAFASAQALRAQTPIFPPFRYSPAARLHLKAKLDDGFQIGRRRPTFQLAVNGMKEYRVPVGFKKPVKKALNAK